MVVVNPDCRSFADLLAGGCTTPDGERVTPDVGCEQSVFVKVGCPGSRPGAAGRHHCPKILFIQLPCPPPSTKGKPV